MSPSIHMISGSSAQTIKKTLLKTTWNNYRSAALCCRLFALERNEQDKKETKPPPGSLFWKYEISTWNPVLNQTHHVNPLLNHCSNGATKWLMFHCHCGQNNVTNFSIFFFQFTQQTKTFSCGCHRCINEETFLSGHPIDRHTDWHMDVEDALFLFKVP